MEITKELVNAIKKSNRRETLLLYQYTYNKLMSVAVRFFVNEEDRMTIVNNSFLKIIKNIENFKIGNSYFSWVTKIVHHEIIDTYRKNKKYKSMFSINEFNENIEDTNDSKFEGNLTETELLNMVNQLPKASKIVFNMYTIDGGYTYKDIAEILNVSVETVKWHLKNARKELKLMILRH